MKKFLLGCTVLTASAYAGSMGVLETYQPYTFIKLGSGGSYAMPAGLKVDTTYWDASPEGYNGTLGSTALFSAAFGYRPSSFWGGDVEYIYRPAYAYVKHQTSTAVTTLDFNGNKNRYFNLASNSLMVNGYLYGKEFNVYSGGIEPFIGGGLGVSFNNVYQFHTVRDDQSTTYFRGVEQDNFRMSLAWQLSAGLQLVKLSKFNLSAGYRYYNGGTFTSAYFVINTQNIGTPWKGTVQANEFFVTAAYRIND
jgi:hypothetical protein